MPTKKEKDLTRQARIKPQTISNYPQLNKLVKQLQGQFPSVFANKNNPVNKNTQPNWIKEARISKAIAAVIAQLLQDHQDPQAANAQHAVPRMIPILQPAFERSNTDDLVDDPSDDVLLTQVCETIYGYCKDLPEDKQDAFSVEANNFADPIDGSLSLTEEHSAAAEATDDSSSHQAVAPTPQ